MRNPPLLRLLLNPWIWVGSFLMGTILFGILVGMLWWTRPNPLSPKLSTAALSIIEVPTATLPPSTPPVINNSTPTALPPSPPPGVIGVGAYVQVTGTGGDGLRLRQQPALDSPVLFIGLESEVFQVKEGPREGDGYSWWYLVAPADEARYGWGVANFLSVVQNP